MKLKYTSMALILPLLLGFQQGLAQDAGTGKTGEREATREAYQAALEAAEHERQAAQEAIERAREEMSRMEKEQAARRSELAAAQSEQRAALAEEQSRQRAELAEERAAMREELSRVHEELRKASREVARLHRELDHSRIHVRAPRAYSFNVGDRAVIGVILGENTDSGVRVLGVSPDGPADRAGLKQGDVIIGMMDRPLSGDGSANARSVLNEVMEGVKAGDEIGITVLRDGEEQNFTVKAEKREPFSWQSIIRLPSAPEAPGAPGAGYVTEIIENIEIPEIDEEALSARVEAIREKLDDARVHLDMDAALAFAEAPEAFEYRWETLSEFGDDALRETNVWFGLPATRGLKLAEMGPGLGEYFDTERGVLVLKARDDNDLQLQAGDVILAVGGKDVNKPSDVMRALRDWEPGASIEIRIKRDHSDRNLEVVRPERSLGQEFVPLGDDFDVSVHVSDH